MVPKYGWPELSLHQLRDTQAMCAQAAIPQSLGKAAEALGLPADKQKDKRGQHLIRECCVPPFNDDPALLQELYEYCKQDVVVERELAQRLPDLSPPEQAIWEQTQRINLRGVPVDMPLVNKLALRVAERIERLELECEGITGGVRSSQRARIVAWACEQGYPMGGYTASDVRAALADPDCPDNVRRVLQIRAAASKTSTAKYKKVQQVVAGDRTLKHMLTYHGAATGRFSSRGGLNVQNIARPTVDVELALEAVNGGR